MDLNWFDAATAGLILFIGVKGIFNGFLREFSGLVGAVAGVWAASWHAKEFGAWLNQRFLHIDSVSGSTMIGFLVLLASIWLGFVILGALLHKKLKLPHGGTIDRALGFVCASLKVFFILSVLVYALYNIEIFRKNAARHLQTSLLFPLTLKTGSAVLHLGTSDEKEPSANEGLENEAKRFIQGVAGAKKPDEGKH